MTVKAFSEPGTRHDVLWATAPHDIARPVMTQGWRDVSFAHWAIDPERVQTLLPDGVEVETFDGQAWISLVGFEMRCLRLRGMPIIPTTANFAEFNVRTYVTGTHGPGVWFFSLDTAHWLPTLTARAAFALPYCVGTLTAEHAERRHAWTVARRWPDRRSGSLVVTVEEAVADPEPLDVFLTGRWRLYAQSRYRRRLLSAPVAHEEWPLRRATVLDADPGLAPDALGPLGEPLLAHHSAGVTVRVGRPRWV